MKVLRRKGWIFRALLCWIKFKKVGSVMQEILNKEVCLIVTCSYEQRAAIKFFTTTNSMKEWKLKLWVYSVWTCGSTSTQYWKQSSSQDKSLRSNRSVWMGRTRNREKGAAISIIFLLSSWRERECVCNAILLRAKLFC